MKHQLLQFLKGFTKIILQFFVYLFLIIMLIFIFLAAIFGVLFLSTEEIQKLLKKLINQLT